MTSYSFTCSKCDDRAAVRYRHNGRMTLWYCLSCWLRERGKFLISDVASVA